MDFGWLAPFGAGLVAGALLLLLSIARNVEKSRAELESIKNVLLAALFDDDRRYSQVRRIAEATEHANKAGR